MDDQWINLIVCSVPRVWCGIRSIVAFPIGIVACSCTSLNHTDSLVIAENGLVAFSSDIICLVSLFRPFHFPCFLPQQVSPLFSSEILGVGVRSFVPCSSSASFLFPFSSFNLLFSCILEPSIYAQIHIDFIDNARTCCAYTTARQDGQGYSTR